MSKLARKHRVRPPRVENDFRLFQRFGFCAGVSIVTGYKKNAAGHNLSCLYVYKLAAISAPMKNC